MSDRRCPGLGLTRRRPCQHDGRASLDNAGYALYLVLVILTIVGVFAGVMLTASQHARTITALQLKKLQARELAYSSIARAEYFLNGGDGHDFMWETDSFQEAVEDFGVVGISCRRFGVFSLLCGTGTRIDVTSAVSGLVGRRLPEELDPVVTLTGSIAGLLIADNTVFRGSVVFTNGYLGRGPRKQRVAGSNAWTVLRRSGRLPFDPGPIDTALARFPAELAGALSDSSAITGDVDAALLPDSVRTRQRIVVLGDCRVGGALPGRGTVLCAGTITFGTGAAADGRAFVAESVFVAGGTSRHCLFFSSRPMQVRSGLHDSQFFSTDSITVMKECASGPSTVWVSKRSLARDTVPAGGIYFKETGRFQGTALCYADSTDRLNYRLRGTDVRVGKGAIFAGNIITDGECVLGAREFHGHLWAQSVSGMDTDGRPSPSFLYCGQIDTAGPAPSFPLVGGLPMTMDFRP